MTDDLTKSMLSSNTYLRSNKGNEKKAIVRRDTVKVYAIKLVQLKQNLCRKFFASDTKRNLLLSAEQGFVFKKIWTHKDF